MKVIPFNIARQSALGLLLVACMPSWSAKYELKAGSGMECLQKLDCCNHDSLYMEMDQNGGIWFWKYGNRVSSLINSGQIPRRADSSKHRYYLEVPYDGGLHAIHESCYAYAKHSDFYWWKDLPKGTNTAGYNSYVRLVADQDHMRVRLEFVVPNGDSSKIIPISDWY